MDGADFLAALEASCLRGALPPVDLPTRDVSRDIEDRVLRRWRRVRRGGGDDVTPRPARQ